MVRERMGTSPVPARNIPDIGRPFNGVHPRPLSFSHTSTGRCKERRMRSILFAWS